MTWQHPIRPRDSYSYSLPGVTQAQAQLDGERVKGLWPRAVAALAGFINRQIQKGGDPFLYQPPGTVLSIRPALQSTDYIHMVRDISMKPALAVESSIGSTPQMVSVFAQNFSQWQVGSPAFNYGYQSYSDWLKAQIGAVPNVAGQTPAKPTPAT